MYKQSKRLENLRLRLNENRLASLLGLPVLSVLILSGCATDPAIANEPETPSMVSQPVETSPNVTETTPITPTPEPSVISDPYAATRFAAQGFDGPEIAQIYCWNASMTYMDFASNVNFPDLDLPPDTQLLANRVGVLEQNLLEPCLDVFVDAIYAGFDEAEFISNACVEIGRLIDNSEWSMPTDETRDALNSCKQSAQLPPPEWLLSEWDEDRAKDALFGD